MAVLYGNLISLLHYLTFESFRLVGPEAMAFFRKHKPLDYLLQRISIAIQRSSAFNINVSVTKKSDVLYPNYQLHIYVKITKVLRSFCSLTIFGVSLFNDISSRLVMLTLNL